jgi:predicted CXXCH cytochrome family protein
MVLRLLTLALGLALLCTAADEYAGSTVCAGCHHQISESQSKTAMAKTWRTGQPHAQQLHFDEGSLHYQVQGDAFSVAAPGSAKLTIPVDALVGGERHGISFLLGLDQWGGLPLERPAMVEARYALSHTGALVLSPGFRKEHPADQEDELGRTLSPSFEARCLSCHGKPGTLGAGKLGGVQCESCHGPALAHVESVTSGKSAAQMVRPASLKGPASMEVCAQCHSSLSANGHIDPMPEDLLVSSQVLALRNTECFIQSGENVACTSCHNPHEDSTAVAQKSVAVCLQCHSSSARPHAAICPKNQTQGCIGCHMPTVPSDSFQLTDHWIRVHRQPGNQPVPPDPKLQSQLVPKREYLRLIVTESDEKMAQVTARLAKGEAFRSVAHDLSVDPTAPGGGFLGDVALADMDPKLAAAVSHLPHDGSSAVVESGGRRFLFHRLPRDFKWDADRLYTEAVQLNNHGERAKAVAKNEEALQAYPYFLRALILMGTILGEAGNPDRAAQVLQFSTQLYPKDASAEFNLALTLNQYPAKQIEALRRAIELDPDMVAAYQSLGASLYASGQPAAAIDAFRRGLQIDPLSASLYYDLGLALQQQGDASGAKRALDLATRIDPKIQAQKQLAPNRGQ